MARTSDCKHVLYIKLYEVTQKEFTENCKACNGTGAIQIDYYNSSRYKMCDKCCQHGEGWLELGEYYGKDNGKMCCKRGCGTLRGAVA